jgi:Protein of unknown function (DUF1573)
MKKIILSFIALSFSAVLFAQKTVADVAKFTTDIIDQGKLKLNDPKEVRFIVTNISKDPLVIEQANPTCGCTMGDYTKSPIPPNGTGFISAKFNAASVGHFDKHLTVKFAGVDEVKSITITGDVLSPEDYDKWVAENPVKKVETTPTATVIPATTPANTAKKGKSKRSKNKAVATTPTGS